MPEAPDVPNWGRPGKGRRLGPGQTYAVEPMVCAGRPDTALLDDGWTVVTPDGGLAAHAEHTIAISENGHQVLTLRCAARVAHLAARRGDSARPAGGCGDAWRQVGRSLGSAEHTSELQTLMPNSYYS